MKTSLILIAGAALTLATLPSAAMAQSQFVRGEGYFNPANEAPPLVVRKRAFTDSGTAVPVGYENSYMTTQTTLNRPTYSSYMPDNFGRDVLPHSFDGLGLN